MSILCFNKKQKCDLLKFICISSYLCPGCFIDYKKKGANGIIAIKSGLVRKIDSFEKIFKVHIFNKTRKINKT